MAELTGVEWSSLGEEFTITGCFKLHGLLAACRNPVPFHMFSPKLSGRSLFFKLSKGENSDVLGVHVQSAKGPASFYDVEINLRAWDGTVVASQHWASHPLRNGSTHGWKEFCQISDIEDFLADNDLAIIQYSLTRYGQLEGFALPHTLQSTRAIQRMPRLTASLFDDVTTSDICFVFEECGTNPRSINAHSQILAKASSYFARLLSANNEETSENDAVVKQETGNDPPSLYLAEDESVASISQQSSIISSGYVAIRHASHVNVDNPGPRKRTFFIIDTPYETYRAVLFYLYTGSIEFAAPKVAHATENSGSDEMADTDDEQGALYWNFANYYEAREYDMSRGEPKSVYELADKMGIPELKEAAALCIQNSLTPENVVAELFSDFTGRHPEFQELQIKHVIDHWDEIATTSAMQEVLESPNPRTAQIMLRLFAGLGKK